MSTPPTPLLEADRIARRPSDGRGWLIENASVAVSVGMRMGVTGASGSGKTLLLRAMALLDPIDEGRVLFKGRPVHGNRVPTFRRDVMYLHQRPALADETVEAVLRYPFQLAAHHGRSFDTEQVVAWLERLGRDGTFLAKRTADLSGGERQIVALLRALQLEPSVLLLDEPTASLDRTTADVLEDLLSGWVAQSPDTRAMVWVTHDANQAKRMTETIVEMKNGQLRPLG